MEPNSSDLVSESHILDDTSYMDDGRKAREVFTTVTLALLCIVIPITILGNSTTIVAFIKVRSLREKPSDLLILALSFADLGIGFALAMLFPVTAIGYWPWGEVGCQFYVFFANICVFSGVIITACISWDRYLLISREYPKYVKIQTRKNVIITILLVYGYATLVGIIELSLWNVIPIPIPGGKESFNYDRECRSPPKHNFSYAVTMFMVNMFLPMIVIELLSFAFVILLRRKLKRRVQVEDRDMSGTRTDENTADSTTGTTRGTNSDNQNAKKNTRNRYTKAAITLGALVIALNICLPPFVLYILTVSFFCPECSNGLVRDMLSNLTFFNSCLNPLLYAATMGKIRRFYKTLILCKRRV
ncbi:D(1A) dopamine receptor-like [Amphiura filiformis]|uniref:D(1A) dopamine receptor-like n=1 Tax=Amphiura filiformis TaxID=82378 RepID=UPI003B228CCB